jgi:D-serine deaminase-like pyridoxal phosphate-dependent protein
MALPPTEAAERFRRLAAAIAGQPLPTAILDLDALEANARAMLVRAGGMPVRLASKSIRCTEVLRRVQALSRRFAGVQCYSGREAAWLAGLGFDDLVVAYPTVDSADLDAIGDRVARGKRIVLMVDDPAQLELIAARARVRGVVFPVAIDLDCSTPILSVHFGVRRSPIHTPEAALALAREIAAYRGALNLVGLMGYEGQIASLQDDVPGQRLRNSMLTAFKHRSIEDLTRRRSTTAAALRSEGFAIEFVNGGGTGSLESTSTDSSVTEVTVGSGLYSPGLFDHFRLFHHTPSLFYALPVTRKPISGIVTCLGGGYIASGPAGTDRLPRPFLPVGVRLLAQEGAGEVQTPVSLPPGIELSIGDPIFFRHAKAGELAERFTHFLLLRDGVVVGTAPTYRGEGQCFI